MSEFKFLNEKGQIKFFNGYLCEGTELNVLGDIYKIVNTGKSVVIYFFSEKIAEYGYENFEQEKEYIEYFCDRQLHYRFSEIAEENNSFNISNMIDREEDKTIVYNSTLSKQYYVIWYKEYGYFKVIYSCKYFNIELDRIYWEDCNDDYDYDYNIVTLLVENKIKIFEKLNQN